MALTRRALLRSSAPGAGAIALDRVGALLTAPGASTAAVTAGHGGWVPADDGEGSHHRALHQRPPR